MADERQMSTRSRAGDLLDRLAAGERI